MNSEFQNGAVRSYQGVRRSFREDSWSAQQPDCPQRTSIQKSQKFEKERIYPPEKMRAEALRVTEPKLASAEKSARGINLAGKQTWMRNAELAYSATTTAEESASPQRCLTRAASPKKQTELWTVPFPERNLRARVEW